MTTKTKTTSVTGAFAAVEKLSATIAAWDQLRESAGPEYDHMEAQFLQDFELAVHAEIATNDDLAAAFELMKHNAGPYEAELFDRMAAYVHRSGAKQPAPLPHDR